jgi:tetratricopeptide (TPR) repeat protein
MNTISMLWAHMKGFNLAETRMPSLGLAYSYGLHPAPAAAVGLADRGLRYSEQAHQIANEQSDLLTLGHIYTFRAMACFASGRYSQGIDFGLRGGEYLKSAGDPFLRYIAEIHAVLCYWQQGKTREAIELGIEWFERSLKLGQNAGMAGSLYVLTLTVEGRLPRAALRSCFTVSDDNHFDHSNSLQGEGVWHLHYARYGDAVAALEKGWLRARKNYVFTPYTISGISWLLTAMRQYRQNSSVISQREQRELLKKTRTYIRQARRFALMCPMAKPHLFREIGLFCEYRSNAQKALRWLQKSLHLADEFGSALEASKTRIEVARLSETLGMPHDSDKLNEAKTTLKRIREETEAAVSAKWRLSLN